MSETTMAQLFEDLGHPYMGMIPNEPIDVHEMKKQILSCDVRTGEVIWADITRIVRKDDDVEHLVSVRDQLRLSVAPLHLFWARINGADPVWIEAMALVGERDVQLMAEEEWEPASIKRAEHLIPVLDLEVEGTNCYFSNGVLSHNTMYGDPLTTPGGKAVPYHASVRIRLNRRGTEKGEGEDKDSVMGVNTAAKLVKNRLGPPLRKCHFFISFAHGIEDEPSWLEYLHEQGVIAKGAPDAAVGFVTVPTFKEVLQRHWLDEAQSGRALLEKERDLEKQKELRRLVREAEEQAARSVQDPKDEKRRGWQFRESDWLEVLEGTPGLKKWIVDKLDGLLVVRYGQRPKDASLDGESLMEVEQVVEDLIDPKKKDKE